MGESNSSSSSNSSNSRHLSRLIKSCFPNPSTDVLPTITNATSVSVAPTPTTTTTISSLPDDLLLLILSHVPTPSLPHLPSVCRRWSLLLLSPSFPNLHRLLHPLRPSLLLLSPSSSLSCLVPLPSPHPIPIPIPTRSLSPPILTSLPHARLVSLGPHAFLISPSRSFLFDSLTLTLTPRSPMLTPRKNFASASLSGKIYVAGGKTSPPSTVEEYDPGSDSWRVVASSSRGRYGCVGAAADGVFYVIGGLRFGGGREAHVYASSMDLYDVEAGVWLRSRSVPGGGCVVGACSTEEGFVYVLASHAVESSFWRFDGRRRKGRKGGGGGRGGFGEWRRMKSPPMPAQVRLDATVKFGCVAVGEEVAVVQVGGCIDDLLRRSGRSGRGLRGGLLLVYHTISGEWSRGSDLPGVMSRALCTSVFC
ncbi:hypothetical protein MLD38_004150 [Melastoma candidum]|uniref:Uncharacterized protein n=1 Tax=Melastoma candidum TaxID=119954 RepID=A0ACB9S5K1_9MYRT|nr:hypothetical protein MLD38_004150 [Melastoma candidum]